MIIVMKEHIHIFDTTLRDGEQCPGAAMNVEQKIQVAMQLETLGVDIIEAGFPVISDGDFRAVRAVAECTEKSRVCGLARCVEKDIITAHEALKAAGERERIHLVVATSPIHRKYKLGKSREQIRNMAVKSVAMASDLCGEVQFSAEDASRTEPEFLAEIVESVIDAGAAVINIPDTVGYTMPEEYFRLISHLKSHVPNVDRVRLSVHCHDDMGMAVANSLAAIRAGARQVEGTINGIGERAGNTALEEVIMALHARRDFFSEVWTGIRTNELVRTSRMVAAMSGLAVPRSKAVVGANAFAHGSGIHQDGVLKNRSTYEVLDPAEIGWGTTELPLTKHSGRHAVNMRLRALGLSVPDTDMPRLFELFKKQGDQCKFVYDDDLAALVDSL